ncbi:hypothetical protein ACFWPV_36180 [Streptomyces uncialis]|uniref:hypothetical protein n=1 Tax=Streptomyces uncialis TaxID=1048205 RepID=UPI0036529678
MPCITSQNAPAHDGAQTMAGLEAEAQRVITTSLAQMAAAVSVLVTLHPLLPLVVLLRCRRQGRRTAPRGSSTRSGTRPI